MLTKSRFSYKASWHQTHDTVHSFTFFMNNDMTTRLPSLHKRLDIYDGVEGCTAPRHQATATQRENHKGKYFGK